MKTMLFSLVLALGLMTASAVEKTWTGKISDSTCGVSHKKGAEHGGKTMSDHDCTLACVKNGAKFVFVHTGKVYKIENQDFASLTEHAGHTVILKGDLTGDTFKVSSMEMPAKK